MHKYSHRSADYTHQISAKISTEGHHINIGAKTYYQLCSDVYVICNI